MKQTLKTLTPKELKQIRTAIAVGTCIKFPNIYEKLFSEKGFKMNENEALASAVLKELCNLEPSVKAILGYYFK
jgi:hypothetical protein